MRLLVEVGKKIAEHQTSSSNKELKDRLDSIDQRTKNQEDAQNRVRQMEAAAEFLYRQGGTAKYLADEIRTKGEDSHLARTWLGTPGITTDYRAMILNGMGLAAAFDRARENGNGEPVVPQAPAPQVDASSGPKPKASNKSDKLTTPKEPDEEVLRQNILANLRSSKGPTTLNDW
jgi:hypothetical protein